MSTSFKALLAKGDALSPRERVILFLLLLAGVWAVVDLALNTPLERARKAEAMRIQTAHERMQKAQDALAQQALQVSPDVAAQRRLEAARDAFNARMAEARRLQAHMVAPKDMPQVLRDLTRAQPGLRLVSLKTLPPAPVGEAAAPDEAGMYRHGITLTLAGPYAGLVAYMQALEKLPVGFFWARAELDAGKHPELLLTLTLNTLSLERQWLTL